MEAPNVTNGRATGTGYAPKHTSTNGNAKRSPQPALNFNFITRDHVKALYWWALIAWCLFSFGQSINGTMIAASKMSLSGGLAFLLCLGVTGAEGIVLAWAFCPGRGLVTKAQEKILKVGTILILLLQGAEITTIYAFQLAGEGSQLFIGMGVASALIGIVGVVTSKLVISREKKRIISLENNDTQIRTAIANAEMATMKARHNLLAMKSILKIEAEVIRLEQMQALNALRTKESRQGIEQIGQGRVKAVIGATAANMQRYALRLLSKAGTNTPVNPRSLNGSSKK